jgi:hypothetical protein
VAFLFDFSGLPGGEGRRIDEAFLEWRITGVPPDRHTEYSVYLAQNAWTPIEAARGATVILVLTDPFDTWEFEPLDYQRNQGGRLRFDLTTVVRDWTQGVGAKHGVVVSTRDVGRAALASQLMNMVLEVRFGFVR